MKLGQNLLLEQSQKLIITPQLRQAIEILQLPILELKQFIEGQLVENPVLELQEEAEAEEGEGPDLPDEEILDYFADSSDLGYAPRRREEIPPQANERLIALPTLHDYLHEQLRLSSLSTQARSIGAFLIDSVDDLGYLRISRAEAAELLGVERAALDEVADLIQAFDPPGVGAETLEDCLLIQARRMGNDSPLVERIIRDHLTDIGTGRLNQVAQAMGLPVEEVQAAADLVRSLNPKPGSRFEHPGDVRYILPDVVVERVNGEYIVLVNDPVGPRLFISPLYRRLARSAQTEADIGSYLKEKLASALWLIKSIEQRRMTLLRVTEAIIRNQLDFLDRGIRYLRPLTMRQIAEELGIHESTVSRTVADKFVQTPQGVHELRFFFTSGVRGAGRDYSSQSIKRMLQELIDNEDPQHPLSDRELAEALGRAQIEVSRRTVAKYREEMGIAASGVRKRY
ncbi:MAG: RNA polymerase factor sigma-54 [Bacillota bacterium]